MCIIVFKCTCEATFLENRLLLSNGTVSEAFKALKRTGLLSEFGKGLGPKANEE